MVAIWTVFFHTFTVQPANPDRFFQAGCQPERVKPYEVRYDPSCFFRDQRRPSGAGFLHALDEANRLPYSESVGKVRSLRRVLDILFSFSKRPLMVSRLHPAMVSIARFRRRTGKRYGAFMRRQSLQAALMRVRQASAQIITPTTGTFVRDPDGHKIEAVTYTAREAFDVVRE